MSENDWRKFSKPVKAHQKDLRLDAFLSEQYRFFSRTQWKKQIQSGRVRINGKLILNGSYKIKELDVIENFYPESEEPSVNGDDLQVLWNEGGVAAVLKPAGLPMHEHGRFHQNTFLNRLKSLLGMNWSFVHRLDFETSGVVLCAETSVLRAKLAEQFESRTIKKEYLCIMRGVLNDQVSWLSTQAIAPSANGPVRRKRVISEQGQHCETYFRILAKMSDQMLVRARLYSGRTHQIRLHAAHKGHPLLGEKKHIEDESIFIEFCENGCSDRVVQASGSRFLFLHAWKLQFCSPFSGRAVRVCAPLPEHWREHLSGQSLMSP